MLHNHAVDIANQYPVNGTREKYLDAAMRLRLPYWDWALDPDPHEGVMPSSLRRPTALITAPNGTQHEIPNPLLQYDFHPLNPSDFAALVSVCPN
jgi:tyrosinase